MATLTYSTTNPNADAFESFFAAPGQVVFDNDTAAEVRIARTATFFTGQAVFAYGLSNGQGPTPTIYGFTLCAPDARFGNPAPLLTYDFDPLGAGITMTTLLAGLYGGTANPVEQLLSGDDTITSEGAAGRVHCGYAGNDTIFAGSGGDYIVGGSGADLMYGGGGDDDFEVDNPLDQVFEADVPGVDRVLAHVGWILGAGSHVEEIHASATAGSIALAGNELANKLFGNNGANVLNGGAGGDQMAGGLGDDIYVVDCAADLVIEAGAGTDTVAASASYVLSSGAPIEFLVASDGNAATRINLTGSASANTIVGNAGVNVLNGLAGDDVMCGLGGSDGLAGASGNDLLKGGFDNDRLDGGSGHDRLFGEYQNDTLLGGIGVDTMSGGAGRDTFVFNTTLGPANVDRITDFRPVDDTIQLENAIFKGLAPGKLAAAAFHVSTSAVLAHDPSDRIVYHKPSGCLFYDANGNAAGGAVKFAQLAAGLTLTHGDFFVI
jgi:serralysin